MPDTDTRIHILNSADEIVLPKLQELYLFWENLKKGKAAPHPAQVNLIDLDKSLPDLVVVDVEGQGPIWHYKIRFVGTDNVERIGTDITGINTTTFKPSHLASRSIEVFNLVASSKSPVLNGPTRSSIEGKEFMTIQSLSLPLIMDGAVSHILVVIDVVKFKDRNAVTL